MSILALCAGLSMLGGCNRRMLSAFFDLPQSPGRASRAPDQPGPEDARGAAGDNRSSGAPTPVPVLEGTLDPDSAVKLLPKDGAGNIDWVAAQRRGIIRPRSTLPGRPVSDSTDLRFGYDFFMQNADTSYDVSFAHSTHAQLLSCGSCHPRLFPYRGSKMSMDDLGKGAYCAACHDKVAFPVETGCERCHTRLPPAEGGAKPVLLGTSTLSRARPDTAAGKSAPGDFAGLGTDQLPASRFTHWVHRARFACKACHTELFVPKAGANVITMKMMADGKACGACHDGKSAFGVSLNNCDRCHIPAVVPTPKK